MRKSILFLWLALCSLAFSACTEEEPTEPRPPVADASALDPFFEQYGPAKQTFTVSAQDPQPVTGAQGTVISFGQPAFLSGTNFVFGQVTIDLVEAYSRGDMLLLQKPTISNGRLLISAGQLYVKASQQNNRLAIGVGEIRVPRVDSVASSGQMELFYQTAPGEFGFNWMRAQGADTTAVTFVPADSAGTFGPYYRVAITTDTLGWITISHLNNQSGSARAVYGQLNGLSNYDGFVTYAVYKNVRAVSPFTTYVNGEIASIISLPDEQEVKLVSFGKQDGQFYYGDTNLLSGPKINAVQITVNPISETELVDLIKAL